MSTEYIHVLKVIQLFIYQYDMAQLNCMEFMGRRLNFANGGGQFGPGGRGECQACPPSVAFEFGKGQDVAIWARPIKSSLMRLETFLEMAR